MNINNLYGAVGGSSISSVGSTGGVPSASPSSIPPPMSAGAGASSATISGPAQFFSEMEQLCQLNPTQFKAVAAQVATAFQNAAGQASGRQAQALTALANQFSQAAQTGSLQPPQAAAQGASQAATPPASSLTTSSTGASDPSGATGIGHHHHRHHHGGAGSSSIQQAFQNALSIVDQALQGTSSGSSPSTPSTSTASA